MVRLGSNFPFRKAAALFAALNQTVLSDQTVRRQSEGAGAVRVELEAQAQADGGEAAGDCGGRLELGLISIDGAMVPLLKGEWGEVRTMAVGEVVQVVNAKGEVQPHARHLSYPRSCTS